MAVYKIVAKGLLNGEDETANVFCAESDNEDYGLVGLAATQWVIAMFAPVLAFISTKWRLVAILVFILNEGVWRLVNERDVTDTVGVNGDNPLPNQMAGVVTAATSAFRTVGKKFIAGLVASHDNEGVLLIDLLTALYDFAGIWINSFTSDEDIHLNPRIFSEKTVSTNPIVGAHVDSVMGTQRRRKQGVGS